MITASSVEELAKEVIRLVLESNNGQGTLEVDPKAFKRNYRIFFEFEQAVNAGLPGFYVKICNVNYVVFEQGKECETDDYKTFVCFSAFEQPKQLTLEI